MARWKIVQKPFPGGWLYLLNYFVLQLFCVRLAKVYRIDDAIETQQLGWSLVRWVKPFTGWNGDQLRFFGRMKT